jgi:uncharacterized iron-regulated membrane protein
VRTLQNLHFDLLGGRTGRVINGAGAALLLMVCLTGLVIWWPGLPNWRRAFIVGFRRPWRRVVWEVHSLTGICSVAVIAMWAITGLYFAFPSPYRAVVNWLSPLTISVPPTSLAPLPTQAPRPWRELIERAHQQRPGEFVARMVPPADGRAAFLVMFSPVMPLPAGRADLTPVYVDQYSGAVLAAPPSPRRIGDVVMEWSAWLHVGGFGGDAVRVVWFVLGLAPPLLFATGFTMWWGRVGARARREHTATATSSEPLRPPSRHPL